jgi:quinol monooxygenase YgiN
MTTPMTKQSVRVVARIIAFHGKVEETKAMLMALIEPTRQEAGCLKYELLQNQADPTDFTFVEEWASVSALHAHMGSAHVAAAMEQVPDLVEHGPDIRQYSVIA